MSARGPRRLETVAFPLSRDADFGKACAPRKKRYRSKADRTRLLFREIDCRGRTGCLCSEFDHDD